MNDIDALAERIDKLEMLAMHQDQIIENLNQVITDQWVQIDRLKRKISDLDEQLSQVEASPALGGQREPPPPHY